MQSYFFWKTADVCQELTEVEQILRYFRRDIYTRKKMKLYLQAGSESRLSYACCAIAASA